MVPLQLQHGGRAGAPARLQDAGNAVYQVQVAHTRRRGQGGLGLWLRLLRKPCSRRRCRPLVLLHRVAAAAAAAAAAAGRGRGGPLRRPLRRGRTVGASEPCVARWGAALESQAGVHHVRVPARAHLRQQPLALATHHPRYVQVDHAAAAERGDEGCKKGEGAGGETTTGGKLSESHSVIDPTPPHAISHGRCSYSRLSAFPRYRRRPCPHPRLSSPASHAITHPAPQSPHPFHSPHMPAVSPRDGRFHEGAPVIVLDVAHPLLRGHGHLLREALRERVRVGKGVRGNRASNRRPETMTRQRGNRGSNGSLPCVCRRRRCCRAWRLASQRPLQRLPLPPSPPPFSCRRRTCLRKYPMA